MKYPTASRFLQALADQLHTLSHKERLRVSEMRRHIAFDRLLARVFRKHPSPWILKGGYAMELRLASSRATKDIDLGFQGNPADPPNNLQKQTIESLRVIAEQDLSDFFSFEIRHLEPLHGPPKGGERYLVRAIVDGRVFAQFHLDVAFGDVVLEPTDSLMGHSWLEFAGIKSETYPAVSKEQQFSEKLHAYTRPRRTKTKTRVKDLFDLIVLVTSKSMDDSKVVEAIDRTFRQYGTHDLEPSLPPPPTSWKAPFAAMSETMELSLEFDNGFDELQRYFESILGSRK